MRRNPELRHCSALQPSHSPAIGVRSPGAFCIRPATWGNVIRRSGHLHALLSFFLLFSCLTLHAQQNSQIDGAVVDQVGASVTGAQITLTQDGTGFVTKAETNGSGLFTIPGLNVGTYSLTVSAPGFETYQQNGISLNISEVRKADIKLTVGTVGQTVTVQATALQVQSDSNVVSTLINADQISEIATENRNFAALAALGMGVSSALPDSNTPTSVAANFTISVNGLRQSHNIWLIDGGEADDRGGAGGMSIMPSQDAIAQFETLASNYPPDYGISSGATISLGLKSGTQKFHGELFEFNRNTVFDANSYLNKQTDPITPRLKLNYNIFGGNLGGPVFIPHIYNNSHQRTFFFVNEEWRRLVQASSPDESQAIPAADFPVAGADLHYVAPVFDAGQILTVPKVVGDPAFNAKLAAAGLVPGQPFPNNTIPASLFDPNAVAYLATGVLPPANLANGNNLGSASQPITVRDDVLRVDHRITDKWQILGHYLHDTVTQAYASPMLGWATANYNTITSTLSNPSYSAAIKLTGTISPNLLLEASMNYDGNIINIVNSANSQTPASLQVNKYFVNGSKNLPGVQLGAPYNTQENVGSAPWHNAAQDYDPKLDVSYTRGRHTMKYGFGYNRYTKNQQLFGDPGGTFKFGSLTGDSAMDLVLGLSSNFDQAQALPVRHYVNQTTSFYAMDNWRAIPRLSIQLGIRFDALPHAFERANQVANFNPGAFQQSAVPLWQSNGTQDPAGPGFSTPAGATQPFYLNGMQIAGAGLPRGLVKNDYGTWQPRVGFSYDLFGNGRTVVRGGFGTFYERLQGNDIYNAATNEPFFNDPSASNVYFSDPHTTWINGQTAKSPVFAQGLTTLALNYPAPGVAQYSLGIQRELQPSLILITQYVGNAAWAQNIERNINTYPLSTPLAVRADNGDSSNHSGTNAPIAGCTNPAQVGEITEGIQNPCPGTSLPITDIYRTYRGYAGITQQENSTRGTYNSFQMGLRAQDKHGLSGEIDYTWSHEIDVTTYDLNTTSNPFDSNYDRGSGALDRRHILNGNYIYKLPDFGVTNYLTRMAVGGWEVAGTVIFESGALINNQGPKLGLNYDPVGLNGGYTDRPNLVGKVSYPKKQGEWFTPNAFGSPLPAWAGSTSQGFGNAGKDSVLGPGRLNFTTSLYKTFDISERVHFQFRAESFNTFNHTEFNNVGFTYNADATGKITSNFGQVTSTQDPRVLELGGRLIF
jgi:Carboxypeptidase regulatory-like domain